MQTYFQPTKEEQKFMDSVVVPDGALYRVKAKFKTATQRGKSKRLRFIPLLIPVGVMAILILVAGLTPRSNGTFIEQALAASRAKTQAINEGDVRHIVTSQSPDPASSIADPEGVSSSLFDDWWISHDGKSYAFTSTRSADAKEMKVIRDGIEYVTPEVLALYQAEALSLNENLVNTSADGFSLVTEPDEIVCEPYSSTAEEAAALERRMQNLLGLWGAERNVVPNVTGAIQELAVSPLVKDAGEEILEDGTKAHVYRLSYFDQNPCGDGPVYMREIDYHFDVKTKELKQISHEVVDADGTREARTILSILKDEIVSLASLAVNPLDPAVNGLVALNTGSAKEDVLATTLSNASMINPYTIQNFSCEQDCEGLLVTGNPAPLFVASGCTICNEVLVSAQFNRNKEAILLETYAFVQGEEINLPTQELPVNVYPDQTSRKATVRIDALGTVLSVTINQAREFDLVDDVVCVSGCENLKVGASNEVNVLFIDTCPKTACELMEVATVPMMEERESAPDEYGNVIWTEDQWNGGYAVSVWRLDSRFRFNDNPGEELMHVEYSSEQTATKEALHFDQIVDGHKFIFDLVSNL